MWDWVISLSTISTQYQAGVGSQRNKKENQGTPVQDFSPTGPDMWLWNKEDHNGQWKKTEQFPMPMLKMDTED